jgi:hypothetical protein
MQALPVRRLWISGAHVSRSGKAAAQSDWDRFPARKIDKCDVPRDTYPAHDYGKAHLGSVVVASVWLAFYVIVAIHRLIASSN